MKVIVNYLDSSRKVYDNCDDIDVDSDYIDIYTDPADDNEPCIGLDLNLVKTVFTEVILPDGRLDVSRVYFNKKSAKINSKKEVKTMNETEKNMITEETAAELAEELTAEEAAAEAEGTTAEDFDFAEEFNHKGALFTIDTEGMEAHKASEVFAEVADAPLIMRGIFVNKDTGLGESVSVITTNSIIYFGKTNVENAKKIRENEKAVAALNASGAWFRIREFDSKKFKKKGYAFEFLKKSEIPAEVHEDDACFKW